MRITLYGVRGSIASPGSDTARYGGNTACVYVEGTDGTRLIFDAGTGIRQLGETLKQNIQPLYLFFSHYHWDHIQGFPFFKPVYQSDQAVYLLSDHLSETPKSILDQMSDPHFPVPGDTLTANIRVIPIKNNQVQIGEFTIKTQALNHPGGGCAYRVESPNGSFAYVTDNELFPPDTPQTSYATWQQWLHGVDLLLHDAMYLESERSAIHGWGHSLIPEVLQLAIDAQAKHLILFHHDHSRTDEQLDQIHKDCEGQVKQQQADYHVYIAKERDSYQLNKGIVTHHSTYP